MSEIIENEEIEFPLNEEIIIEILDLRYGKKSLIVEALYKLFLLLNHLHLD